jgi:hypothetical protein
LNLKAVAFESRPSILLSKGNSVSVSKRDAIRILGSLVDGVDPSTGKPLEDETVLQRAEVIRALLAGISVLRADDARAQRRSSLPANIGRRWTEEEDKKLVDLFKRETSLETIATEHGRSVRAIEARLVSKGLMALEDRKTRDRFERD